MCVDMVRGDQLIPRDDSVRTATVNGETKYLRAKFLLVNRIDPFAVCRPTSNQGLLIRNVM